MAAEASRYSRSADPSLGDVIKLTSVSEIRHKGVLFRKTDASIGLLKAIAAKPTVSDTGGPDHITQMSQHAVSSAPFQRNLPLCQLGGNMPTWQGYEASSNVQGMFPPPAQQPVANSLLNASSPTGLHISSQHPRSGAFDAHTTMLSDQPVTVASNSSSNVFPTAQSHSLPQVSPLTSSLEKDSVNSLTSQAKFVSSSVASCSGMAEPLSADVGLPALGSTSQPLSVTTEIDPEFCEFPTLQMKVIEELGTSSFPVYLVKQRKSGLEYILKYIKLENNKITKEIARELCIMLDSNHENVMGLEFASIHEDGLCFIMAVMKMDLKMQLKEHLDDVTPLCMKVWMKQILEGINYIHSRGVIHRDLKPENILVTNDCKLKIADFGLSRFMGDPLSPQVTTIQYRAPELLLGVSDYTQAVDMWSIGCIFHDLRAGNSLFVGGTIDETITDIFLMFGCPTDITWPGVSALPRYPHDLSIYPVPDDESTYEAVRYWFDGQGLDFMKGLLCLNPAMRMTAREALDHPFMQFD